jgi:Fe-S cluster assembly protein SufD
LVRHRADAYDRFAASALPSEAEEIWRYSGIDGFDLDTYRPARPIPSPVGVSGSGNPRPAAASGSGALERARQLAARIGGHQALVVTHNGSVIAAEGGDATPGLAVTPASRHASGARDDEIGELAPGRDAFGELHDAFVVDPVVVRVAPKVSAVDPVVIVHVVDDEDGGPRGVAVFPHLVVRLGAAAEAAVVEIVTGSATGALVVPVAELEVEDDAHLAYANVQVLAPGCRQVAVQASRVGAHASLRSFTVGLGADHARVRTDSDLVGEGGRTSLLAAYLGTGRQVHDFRTLQDHHAARTESELLFKGAVADTARSVYSGLIRIRRGARRADARQSNHNLVLGEGAHADSVPNLDIDENDVRCSHASTVGPIDEEQRYYLESRGVEPDTAQRLIVQGFFADLARRAPIAGVGAWVESALTERLSAALGGAR